MGYFSDTLSVSELRYVISAEYHLRIRTCHWRNRRSNDDGGGNILGITRTMTTAIAMENGKVILKWA
jgi:hypothetical protein